MLMMFRKCTGYCIVSISNTDHCTFPDELLTWSFKLVRYRKILGYCRKFHSSASEFSIAHG